MEVWSSFASSTQQQQQKEQKKEETAAAAASSNVTAWAPLERFESGEAEAVGLLAPVYTGVSLHYR
jgi:hypothetical protein